MLSWSILQYFWPALSWKAISVIVLSGRFPVSPYKSSIKCLKYNISDILNRTRNKVHANGFIYAFCDIVFDTV